MVIPIIIIILVLSFLLIKSTDIVIMSIKRLSKDSKDGVLIISALVLAVSTSLPELFVGISSALEGEPSVSLGSVTGSNIANISLIAGFAALLAGRVRVQSGFLRRDLISAFIAGVLPVLFMLDGSISRIDGVILLVLYAGYATSFFRGRYKQIAQEHKSKIQVNKFIRSLNHINSTKRKEIMKFTIGVIGMLLCAFVIVDLSVYLADLLNIPSFVIGLLVVAVGTSLPEFAFSVRSIEDHEPMMYFGNLLGSVIANSTLVIGLTAVIHPITVISLPSYFKASIFFIIVFLTFWFFIKSKHSLERWEAAMLVVIYFIFVIWEVA